MVVFGFIEIIGLGNLTVVRSFRVLRPLRAITKIEALRVREGERAGKERGSFGGSCERW